MTVDVKIVFDPSGNGPKIEDISSPVSAPMHAALTGDCMDKNPTGDIVHNATSKSCNLSQDNDLVLTLSGAFPGYRTLGFAADAYNPKLPRADVFCIVRGDVCAKVRMSSVEYVGGHQTVRITKAAIGDGSKANGFVQRDYKILFDGVTTAGVRKLLVLDPKVRNGPGNGIEAFSYVLLAGAIGALIAAFFGVRALLRRTR